MSDESPASEKHSTAGWVVFLIVVAVILAIIFSNSGSTKMGSTAVDATPVSQVAADLQSKRMQCAQNVAKLADLGVRVRDYDGYTVAEYYSWAWLPLDHDDKIKQGLLIYCAKMPPSGRYSVMIHDRQSGKELGHVVDGNWSDD